ncbi:MAG: hypothetical protein LGB53_03500 [Sulfurovum sp.]|nr:hypothetical protein [Sulfurovum sp.]
MFNLPSEWEEFYNDMEKSAIKYIRINFWNIHKDDFLLWLRNFETDHEKFLAALIIYRLMYRNNVSMLSMYQYIVDIILPTELNKLGILEIISLDDFHNNLINGSGLPLKFSTIENVDNETGKSGSTILREFTRHGSFHNRLKVSAEELSKIDRSLCKIVVLFDDIMGTGEQFNTYLEKFYTDTEGLILLYCPLSATKIALESFNYEKYPTVRIIPVEILDERYNFFNKAFMPKIAESIDLKKLEEMYIALMQKKTKLTNELCGKGDLALTYLFSVSTPNNTLPILWYADASWNYLVPR